jgi:peptidyl-prolyl cis-trans isomerase C
VRKTIIGMSILLGALSLSAQTAAAPAASADPVIIKAGSTEIRQSEFEAAVGSLPNEYQAFASGPGKRQFAEDYLRLKLLAAEATKSGLDKDAKVRSQLELLKANTLANAQIEKMQSSIQISDAEVREAYEKAKDRLERARASHILIAFEGSPAAPAEGALSDAAAKAKAEEIRARIAGGADFAEIAKTESDDRSAAANGGSLGEFGRGQMVPEFENAVFSAKDGELTPVVRTQFGYHVIRVEKRTTVGIDEVREELEQQARQEKLEAMIDSMQSSATPTFNEEYFGAAATQPEVKPAG